jgi:hypothetical protein
MHGRGRAIRNNVIAEGAGFFTRGFSRKAPQQDQQRLRGVVVGFTMRQHPFDHSASQPGRASRCIDVSDFVTGFERDAERGER